MSHPTHKMRARVHGAHALVSHSRLWHRSTGRHAIHALPLHSTILPAMAGAVAALLIACVGMVNVPRSEGTPGQSFSPLSPSVVASRSSHRKAVSGRWSLESAGEFDSLRAFPLSDAKKIREAVKKYAPKAPADIGGRFQSLGISSHQSPVHGAFEGYDFSECTWWSAVRRAQLGHPVPANMGNGSQWAASARAKGFTVDHTPRTGAVIVFQPGQAAADPVYGHVGVVEAVLSDGSVVISESGETYNGQIRARRIFNASRYEFVH